LRSGGWKSSFAAVRQNGKTVKGSVFRLKFKGMGGNQKYVQTRSFSLQVISLDCADCGKRHTSRGLKISQEARVNLGSRLQAKFSGDLDGGSCPLTKKEVKATLTRLNKGCERGS